MIRIKEHRKIFVIMIDFSQYKKIKRVLMSQIDYYQVLGVEREATIRQIKEAYRNLAFQYHPDRNKGDAEALEKMKALNEAYAVLSEPEKKKHYDNMQQEYGSYAYDRFRQNYSENDIYHGSDINQIFEEMARNFGFRHFNDIFTEFYGKGYQSFEFKRPGLFGKGFIFTVFPHKESYQGISRPQAGYISGLLGKLSGYLLKKALESNRHFQKKDYYDTITIDKDSARQGSSIPYTDRRTSRKLLIKIPGDIKEGQIIRLKNVGNNGFSANATGDLYLKIQFKKNLFHKIKELYNKKFAIKP